MARFKDKPLDFSPGTKWSYSNSGYMLLGYIIEDVAKMSWEKAVRKYIFNKAGMQQSGFDFAHLQHPGKSTGLWIHRCPMQQVPSSPPLAICINGFWHCKLINL